MEFHSINIATGKLTKTLPSLHPPVILGTTHNNHKNFGVIFQKSPTSRQGFEFTFHEKIIDCDYVAAKSIMPLNSIIKLLTSILILKKSLARSYPSALPPGNYQRNYWSFIEKFTTNSKLKSTPSQTTSRLGTSLATTGAFFVAAQRRCTMAAGDDQILRSLGMAHLGSPKALLGNRAASFWASSATLPCAAT